MSAGLLLVELLREFYNRHHRWPERIELGPEAHKLVMSDPVTQAICRRWQERVDRVPRFWGIPVTEVADKVPLHCGLRALGLLSINLLKEPEVTVNARPETILEEAARLTSTDRRGDYGHPLDDFTRTGRLWGALLGIPDIPPETVGLMMAAMKLNRETNKPKRDNRVDAAGYVNTVELVHAERERRATTIVKGGPFYPDVATRAAGVNAEISRAAELDKQDPGQR